MSNNMEIKKYLTEHNIRPSFQRIKIFEYLEKNRNHPVVDTIYKDLVDIIPTISKTTIYNSLKEFEKKGIVNPITIEGNTVRYDIDTSMHGHFKCKKCGEIYDVNFELSEDSISKLDGFEIEDKQLYLHGICPKCK
ncbi:MAG: Fur family transcriptional regulator [Fusobacteriota bacterium]